MFFAAKDGEALYNQQKQDLELTVAQIIRFSQQNSGLNERKPRKNIRTARYDLNQIPYEFTVEVKNKFKGLDLVNTAPEELQAKVCNIVQQAVNKIITKKKKSKKGKWLSEKAL